MSNGIIFALLVIVFGVFVFFIVYALKGNQKKAPAAKADVQAASGDRLQIEVKPKDNGVEILVYNSWEERPSDAELFPDIVNDIAPAKDALDRDFWEKVANIGNIADPAEREKLVTLLADQGVISKDDISTWAMPDPGLDDPEREVTEEPGNESDYRGILDRIEPEEGEAPYVFNV